MAKYKIIGQRYLRKYTAQRTTPVYSARVDVQTIVNTLCDIPWEKVISKEAGMTYHTDEPVGDDKTSGLDMNVKIRDGFDAALFCAEHTGGQHRAYANAAAYVYDLPSELVGLSLKSITLNVTSDPYNSNGARIHMLTTPSPELPTSCRICRGEDESGSVITDGTTLSAVAKRTSQTINGTEYWYPTSEDCTLSPEGGLTLQKYLVVFVLMENYATVRGNWIEGCSFIRNLAEIEIDGDVTGWADGETYDLSGVSATREFNVCRDGILPSLSSQKTGLKTLILQKNGDDFPEPLHFNNNNDKNLISSITYGFQSIISELDGPITSIDVGQPISTYDSNNKWAAAQFAVITGRFSQGSFSGLPGFLIYDLWHHKMIKDIPLDNFNAHLYNAAKTGSLRGGAALLKSSNGGASYVQVFAFFNTGIMEDSQSACAPFAYFTISQDDGTVIQQEHNTSCKFNPTDNSHYVIQITSTAANYYDRWDFFSTSNGVIKGLLGSLGTNGIPYDGEILSISPLCRQANTSRILVSGRLNNINGIACKNCAIITSQNNKISIEIPPFDDFITPDTYENFSVKAHLGYIVKSYKGNTSLYEGPNDSYLVSGSFNTLSNDSKYHKLVEIVNNQLIPCSNDVNLPNIIGAVKVNEEIVFVQSESLQTLSQNYYSADSLTLNITPQQSIIGLRTLFARFYNQKLIEYKNIGKKRIGAGFVVRSSKILIDAYDGAIIKSLSIPVWQMNISTLVVPFSVPQAFNATGIRLDWGNLSVTGGKLNVWLKRDVYVSDMPDDSNPSFYIADKKEIDGWELLGCIDSNETSALFTLNTHLNRCASLLFTAYISLDSLNSGDEMTTPQGICTSMDINSITNDVSGLDTTWKPDITLIG